MSKLTPEHWAEIRRRDREAEAVDRGVRAVTPERAAELHQLWREDAERFANRGRPLAHPMYRKGERVQLTAEGKARLRNAAKMVAGTVAKTMMPPRSTISPVVYVFWDGQLHKNPSTFDLKWIERLPVSSGEAAGAS